MDATQNVTQKSVFAHIGATSDTGAGLPAVSSAEALAKEEVSEPCETRKRGFTLIELMIAIAIGTMILASAFYFGSAFLESTKRSSTKTTLQSMRQLIMLYKQDTGNYPETLSDLKKNGIIKKELPKDGWDHTLVYHLTPDAKNPYELYSYGPEGKGGDKAGRISVWDLD